MAPAGDHGHCSGSADGTVWYVFQTVHLRVIPETYLIVYTGVYFALFVLAMWANHGRSDISSRRLKTVTIVLFVNMVIFVLVRSLQFSRARVLHPPEREFFNWGIPLTVIGNIQTTTIGMLADGLLAWRFYVLYDQQRWALWVPMFFVIINACEYYNHKTLISRLLTALRQCFVTRRMLNISLHTSTTTTTRTRYWKLRSQSPSHGAGS